MKYATRTSAKATGASRYFTGAICPQGHIAERYVSSGRCVDCAKKAAKDWLKNLPQSRKADMRERYGERIKRNRADYYERNKDRERSAARLRAEALRRSEGVPPRKPARAAAVSAELNRQRAKAWREQNPLRAKEIASLKRRVTRDAKPKWYSKTDCSPFYEAADALNMLLGEWHDVDHVVPLRAPRLQSLIGNLHPPRSFIGPLLPAVCAFHCAANLTVLPRAANIAKGNRHWPDMPNYYGKFKI